MLVGALSLDNGMAIPSGGAGRTQHRMRWTKGDEGGHKACPSVQTFRLNNLQQALLKLLTNSSKGLSLSPFPEISQQTKLCKINFANLLMRERRNPFSAHSEAKHNEGNRISLG